MSEWAETPWMREQIAMGLITRIHPSLDRAAELITVARKHISSARNRSVEDPTLALSACHDAARKAIDGLAGAHGLRIENKDGHHKRVLEFAAEAFASELSTMVWEGADRLRERRNDFEYGRKPERTLRGDEIEEHIATAEAIIDAVDAALRPHFPPAP